MTDKMYQKIIDIIIHNSIEKSIEEMNIDRIKNFDFMRDDEELIEVSYSELLHEVKHAFANKYGSRLDREIDELKRRLGQ
jgi:hypothetical protein